MNKEFETIQDRVKAILEISETSRNSDASLVANYWYSWNRSSLVTCAKEYKILGDGVAVHKETHLALPLMSYELVTQPSVIERARRLIQFEIYKMPDATDSERDAKLEQMKKYYPTDPKIIKRRRLSSKLWKDYINTRQINKLVGEINEPSSK